MMSAVTADDPHYAGDSGQCNKARKTNNTHCDQKGKSLQRFQDCVENLMQAT